LNHADRIHFAVYGSGLGHASRTSMVASSLYSPVSVYFTCWGEGLELFRRLGFACTEVPPVDVEWGEAGRMAFKRTLKRFPYAYVNFARQVFLERKIIWRMKPRLVVSDSRLSAIAAAWLSDVPSILLINQLRISLPPVAGGLRYPLERVSAELLAMGWTRSDLIVAPDLPPPYTISEQQLWNVKVAEHKLHYVGFLVDSKPVSENTRRKVRDRFGRGRKLVFAQISGPRPSRQSMLKLLRSAAPLLGQDVSLVVSLGDPFGSTEPQEANGFTYFEWCPVKDELLSASDLVVARAGHTTVAQSLLLGRPGVFLPIPYHGEQWGNAVKAEKLGFARALNPLTVTPRSISEEILGVLSDPSYLKVAEELQGVARRHDGLANMTGLIRRFL